jgi:hypothetical protein
MPVGSTEPLLLPVPRGAPPWFLAWHAQLVSILQRNQQRIDQTKGLRGSISAEEQAQGLIDDFASQFVETVHDWNALQTFNNGISLGGALLDTYVEGSFTATGTGFATPPTGTARYVQLGKLVVLYLPDLQQTSNATTFTVTGLPAGLTPPLNSWHWAPITDNGIDAFGFVQLIATDAVLHVFSGLSLTFTNSGAKRLYPVTIPYLFA